VVFSAVEPQRNIHPAHAHQADQQQRPDRITYHAATLTPLSISA
jgi:hypothetical protein